jgi:ABC-type cobalt transport system substrate-binding protein
MSPNKEKTQYGTTAITIPSATKMGPEGYLYIARKTKDIYRVPPGGGAAVKWGSAPNRVDDFDFSPTGVMYAGGKGDNLYVINPDGTGANVADYPDTYIYAVRVFNGYVYVAGKINATNHYYIWRNQINGDTDLGQKEEVFDWSGTFDPDAAILSMTIAEDGDLYVGTDASSAIIIVHVDGTYEPLYPGLLAPSSTSLSWGNGVFLYVCRRSLDTAVEPHKIIKINMLKKSAPYYGRP